MARKAEALGYASLWTFQRLLHPVGADLGPAHRSVLDPIAALSYAAALTDRIRLGTATICAPFTPPVVLAKALTTVDVLSRGRLTVGLGMGWLPEEHRAAGVPFEGRGERFEAYLRCLAALWTDDPVEVEGDHYVVPRSHVGPPPVQRPRPPLLLGGTAPAALRRAGRLADGWIASSQHDPRTLRTSADVVRTAAHEAGRDPDAVTILVRCPAALDGTRRPGPRRPFHGTKAQILDDLAALRTNGATEAFLDLNLTPHAATSDTDPSEVIAEADRLLEAFAPER